MGNSPRRGRREKPTSTRRCLRSFDGGRDKRGFCLRHCSRGFSCLIFRYSFTGLANVGERREDFDLLALIVEDLQQHTCFFRFDVEDGLFRFNENDDFPFLDGIPHLFQPLDDLGGSDVLSHLRHDHRNHWLPPELAAARPAPPKRPILSFTSCFMRSNCAASGFSGSYSRWARW